jgi:hypothetical protein
MQQSTMRHRNGGGIERNIKSTSHLQSFTAPMSLQGAQYEVRDPFMRPAGAVAGAEQPNIDAHAFSQCTLPLIWWPNP